MNKSEEVTHSPLSALPGRGLCVVWSLAFVTLYGYTGVWWFALPAFSLGQTAAIVGIRLVLRMLIPRSTRAEQRLRTG